MYNFVSAAGSLRCCAAGKKIYHQFSYLMRRRLEEKRRSRREGRCRDRGKKQESQITQKDEKTMDKRDEC